MPDPSPEGETIEINTTYSDNHSKYYVSGVQGGLQPRGDIKAEFTIDYEKAADTETYRLDDQGGLSERTGHEGNRFEREIQATMFLNTDHCASIGIWLLSTSLGIPADEIENQLAANFEQIEKGDEDA